MVSWWIMVGFNMLKHVETIGWNLQGNLLWIDDDLLTSFAALDFKNWEKYGK